MGLEGKDAGNAPFIIAETEWLAATVDKCFFVAPRAMVVQAINARVDTVGSDAGAVTAVIRKVPSGTAITSGTALHTGSINLKGTAATNQALTLTSTAVALAAGDALAIDFTGTMTAAVGTVTVAMTPR
jgi:hypothetical protein